MRILLLEDEPDIAEGVTVALRHDRYTVASAPSKGKAYEAMAEGDVDLAILDVMLPGDDDAGFTVAATLREAGFAGPILFLTARDAIEDRVQGLDIGGDDYLVKPFSLEELRARVRALLRRSADTKRSRLVRGRLSVDLAARRVSWSDRDVALSEREFEMLELFAHFPERVFSTNMLLERFFPEAGSGAAVVRVYISQLRHKLDESVLATVPGGYRLGPP
jgi:two-component system, OmpR family, response regulator QseB